MTDSSQPVAVSDVARLEESAAVSGLFGRDMAYLAFWGLQIVLAAALTPVTTRIMGKTEFGEASAAVAVMQLLNCLLSFSLYTAVQRAYAREDGEENASRLVTLAIGLSLVTGAIAYGTGRWWCPAIGLGPFPAVIRYAVLWSVAGAITAPALGLMRSRDQLGGFVLASTAQSIFAQALALTLIIFVSATSTEYILGQLIGELVTAIIALAIVRPQRLARLHVPMLKDSLRFSSGLVPALIAAFIFNASDRIVIHADLGPTELGRYAVAANIGGFAIVLLELVNMVWMPRMFALKDIAMRRNVLGTSRDGLSMLSIAFGVALVAASPVVLWLWAPPSYDPRTLLLVTALVAAGSLPYADQMIYTQVLTVAGRTRAVATAAMGAALLNLVLNLALVPHLGIDGSAGITCFCYVVGAARQRMAAGSDGPPVNRRALGLLVIGMTVCIASAAVPPFGVALGLRLLVAAVATAGFFVQLLALTRPETLQRLRGRLASR